jgi:hypothetical protein
MTLKEASGGEIKAERLRPWTASRPDHMAPGASTRLDRLALTRIQRTVQSAPVRFMLWDGFEVPSTTAPAVGTILFKNRTALLSWAWDASLNFGETYMSGAIEIRGDLLTVLEAIYRGWESSDRRPWWLLEKSNDAHAARENVHHHYDLGNDFYRLWLDREMVYTCAYFPTADATLEAAQIAKMDLVCRKLRLVPGERVIEAGCGWGSLALFMARKYGVTVRAFNISSEQIAYARNRAKGEGLADRVEFVEDDYRHVGGTCISSAATSRRRSIRGFENASFRAHTHPRFAKYSDRCSSRTPSRCSTWKTCDCTTRRRWNTGASASTKPPAKWRRCSTRVLSARGGSISLVRRRRSPQAHCSCSRSSSHVPVTMPCPGRG